MSEEATTLPPAVPHDEPQLQVENPEMAAAGTDLLIAKLEELDPEHKLADDAYRKELMLKATPEEYGIAVAAINREMKGHDNNYFADEKISLASGNGEDLEVGMVGVEPEDRFTLFAKAVEVTKFFAEKDQLELAGLVLGNAIVGLQLLEDGNKRTARAIVQIAGDGYDGSPANVAEYHRLLDFTREAKQSIYFGASDGALRHSYIMDSKATDQERADSATMLRAREINQWKDRSFLLESLMGIKDIDIRNSVANVLQQEGFGDDIVYEGLKNGVDFSQLPDGDKERAGALKQAIANYLSTLNPEKAQQLIAQDGQVKKQFWTRILDSTMGKDPLPYYYMGERSEGSTVNITGLDLEQVIRQ
jgi:hypothetical protein